MTAPVRTDIRAAIDASLATGKISRRALEDAMLNLARSAYAKGIAVGGRIAQRGDSPTASVDAIQQTVSAYFGVPIQEMTKPLSRRCAMPRQVAMYIAYQFTPLSTVAIGRAFGGRDHTTVFYALRRVREMIETDASFAGRVTFICGLLTREERKAA